MCECQNSSGGKTEHLCPPSAVTGAGIGQNMSFGGLDVLASSTGMTVPAVEEGTGEQEAAQPAPSLLTVLRPRDGRARVCVMNAVHREEFIFCGLSRNLVALLPLNLPKVTLGECQRVTAGTFTPHVQSYLSNNPGHLWFWSGMCQASGVSHEAEL